MYIYIYIYIIGPQVIQDKQSVQISQKMMETMQ